MRTGKLNLATQTGIHEDQASTAPTVENPKCGSGHMWDLEARGGSAKAPA